MKPSFSGLRTGAVALIAATLVAGAAVPKAEAQDFFSALFGGFKARPAPQPSTPLGYGGSDSVPFPPQGAPAPRASASRSSTAYCVRTCDGRYFPVTGTNEQSRVATCKTFCPASETKVYYGGGIDEATAENGKPYSSLPNAFKYRETLVAGCTCNGKDSVGLASVNVEDDKTIRKGDIVAGENGLIVATRVADRRGGNVANFSPAPDRIRAKFERPPIVAQE